MTFSCSKLDPIWAYSLELKKRFRGGFKGAVFVPFYASLFDQLRLQSLFTGNFMAQSNSKDSGLFSIFTDLFVENPKPEPKPQALPQSQPEPPPQPKPQSQPKPKPKPKPKSTPSQRQDELAKISPGSKIIRRPNPMEEADDTTYIKFPKPICNTWIQTFQEAVRLYGKNCKNCSMYQEWIREDCGIAVYYP